MSKKLRAVGYCRTSSTGQKDNTSIPTQKQAIQNFCDRNKWEFLHHYVDESKSGKKIAGREAYQRMMRDAANGQFDVVVPFDVTRFGRDGVDILTSAKTLRADFNVFVVDTKENFDTRDSRRAINNYIQAGISEDERIRIITRLTNGKLERTPEMNSPMGAKRPFGRIWQWQDPLRHSKGGGWVIDKEKQKLVKDCAKRYLAGEAMPKLAKEYGINHTSLHKTLMHRCGDCWDQRVRRPELDIDEVITIKVPRLLDAKTIKALHERCKRNRTYNQKSAKHPYVFGGMVRCNTCGYTMFAQPPNREGAKRYYRHSCKDGARNCPLRPWPYVPADDLEAVVLRHLFDTFGNPVAVQKAIEAATPNMEQRDELDQELANAMQVLAKTRSKKENIVVAVGEGSIKHKDAKPHLDKLSEQEEAQEANVKRLQEQLGTLPSRAVIKSVAEQVSQRFRPKVNTRLALKVKHANRTFEAMTSEEQRALAKLVFAGDGPDGKPLGIYIDPISSKGKHRKFRYTIRGHLIDVNGTIPMSAKRMEALFEFSYPTAQKAILNGGGKSASPWQATNAPALFFFSLNGTTNGAHHNGHHLQPSPQ